LPNPNANGYSDTNAYPNANGYSDADANPNANAYRDANTNGYSDADGNGHADQADADSKAASDAVAAPNAVSEWVKELRQK